MKVDFEFYAFRLLLLSFLLTLVLLTFYVFGTYQSFLDATLETLFSWFRLVAWVGLVLSSFLQLAFLTKRGQGTRRVLNLVILVVLAALYVAVEFLKAWIYPDMTP